MKLYQIILYFIGYSFYAKSKEKENEPIVVTVNIETNEITSERQHHAKTWYKKLLFIFKILYNLAIFTLISWQIIYAMIYSIKHKEIMYIGNYTFQIIFATQYILGLIYFKHSHFIKKAHNLEKYITILFPLCIVVSIGLTITTIILTYHNITLASVSMLYVFSQHMTPFLASLIILDKFYGYASFLINVATFSIIIFDHRSEVIEYADRIEKYMEGSVSISDKMYSISTELIKIKNSYGATVEKLNIMFSSLTIIGLIHIYFSVRIFTEYEIDTMTIINTVLFVIVEYVYIMSAQSFRNATSNISNVIYDNVYASHFSQKHNSGQGTIITIPEEDENDKSLEQSIQYLKTNMNVLHIAVRKLHIYNAEIVENMAWAQLQDIVKQEWEPFKIIGFEIKDSLLIQKLFGLGITILLAVDLVNVIPF